jgi:hypothetical protein
LGVAVDDFSADIGAGVDSVVEPDLNRSGFANGRGGLAGGALKKKSV